jgi:glycosyltransferase involved in cell wall biosynthesis
LRILSLTYEYPPLGGGGGRAAAALNEELGRSGETIDVVTSGAFDLPKTERLGHVTLHRTPCWRRNTHYTTAPELFTTLLPAWRESCRLIEENRPDVIHTHFVLPSGVVAWRLARRYKIPYVITCHGSDIPGYNPDRFEYLHRVLRPLWMRIVAGASSLTSPSEFLAGLIKQRVDLPVRVIPYGYDPATPVGATRRNLVLVVTRLFPRKGVQRFIEAIPSLNKDWEYVIAGDGPYLPQLKEQAERLGAPVRFIGFVDSQTLRSYYEQARIFVFPSVRENFPMVLIEAMDAGCAVVTTDADGCGEVVGKAGIVVAKDSARQIRSALKNLMDNPALCADLGEQARRRVDLFRWTRLSGLYRSVLETAAGGDTLSDTAIRRRWVA